MTCPVTYNDTERDRLHRSAEENQAEMEALTQKAEAAREREPEIITIYYGEDTDEQSAQKLCHSFENWFPDAEVSAVYGGQPLYYYMISIE